MSDAAKRTLRTAVQTLVGLCVLLPSAAASSGLTALLPWAAGAVAVAGALSRVMALPGVQALLPSWLRTDVPVNADAALRALHDPPSAPAAAATAPTEPAAEPAAPAADPAGGSAGFGFTAGSGSGPEGGGA